MERGCALLSIILSGSLPDCDVFAGVLQTSVIPTVEDLDPDVLSTLNSLQCFKDKEKLISDLLSVK